MAMAPIQPIVAPMVTPVLAPVVAPVLAPVADKISTATAGSGGAAFSSLLNQALSNVDSGQHQTAAAMDRFLSGEDTEVHQVALATQQAEMQFDLFMQVRNKVIAAYQEVMKMQI